MEPLRRPSYIIGTLAQSDTKTGNMGLDITGSIDVLCATAPVIHEDMVVHRSNTGVTRHTPLATPGASTSCYCIRSSLTPLRRIGSLAAIS